MSTEIRLWNGRMVDPFRIENYRFSAEDFIHPLSLLNRYTGHTRLPYSVAEHSVHLARRVPDYLRRAAVLHDFNEALTNDMPHPMKRVMREFSDHEVRVQKHLFDCFNEPWSNMLALVEYDRRICQDEMTQAFLTPHDIGLEPLGITICNWYWETARAELSRECRIVGLLS